MRSSGRGSGRARDKSRAIGKVRGRAKSRARTKGGLRDGVRARESKFWLSELVVGDYLLEPPASRPSASHLLLRKQSNHVLCSTICTATVCSSVLQSEQERLWLLFSVLISFTYCTII